MRDPIRTGYEIERAAKDRLDALAAHAGVSSALYFERLIENVELNDQGLPVWWPEELPRDGELPIDSA
jgi:predicted DNA-binding protein